MNSRSFSTRLTWRIIGIVSVIFVISLIGVGVTLQYISANGVSDTPANSVAPTTFASTPWRLILDLMLVGFFGLVLIFFFCRRLIRYMSRPITELSVSAMNMAKGNFRAKLPEIDSKDEMRRLHDSFLYLQYSFTDYISQLKMTKSANERMESELNVARTIQMGMLNTDFPPQLQGDVSGKGVPASLVMSITRAMIHFVATLDLPLHESARRINNSVADSSSHDMFVTLFMARIDLKTLHMTYCNAGHNPLLILPPNGEPYYLSVKSNLAAGLIEDFPYESESIDLEPGTRLVAYTDGVTEAENDTLELFGEDRLLEVVKRLDADSNEQTAVEQV